MKTTKKMMAGIAALLVTVSAFGAPLKSVEELKKSEPAPESDFLAELTEDGKGVILIAYIRDNLKWSDRVDLVIPATIQGYPVVAIGPEFAAEVAFVFRSVVIPEGVVSIGDAAFYGSENLEVLVLPSTLKVIDEKAFMQVGAYSHAKYSCLKELVIPEGVVGIGPEAFSGCYALTSLSLPKSLRFIGLDAFLGASRLTKFEIPEGIHLLMYGSAAGQYPTPLIMKGETFGLDRKNFAELFFGGFVENLALQKRLREMTMVWPEPINDWKAQYPEGFEEKDFEDPVCPDGIIQLFYWKYGGDQERKKKSVFYSYCGYTNDLQGWHHVPY